MKRSLFITVLFLISIQLIVSEQIDNIVLLDTSESMFPYYSGTIDFLIEDIVQEQLEPGDTFHLLSFNDFPEYEISRTIRNESEIQEIFDRILLLQPIGKYTDLISAFSFLYEYTEKLQLNSIKRIIILTDGIHDPPPGSPYPISIDNNKNIVKISENMKRQGWDVSLIQFPLVHGIINEQSNTALLSSDTESGDNINNSSSGSESQDKVLQGENNLFPLIAKTLNETVIPFENGNETTSHDITGSPQIQYPDDLGNVGNKFEAVFNIINHSNDTILLKLNSIISQDGILYDNPVSIKLDPDEKKLVKLLLKLPDDTKKGSYNTDIEFIFNDSYRAYPRNGKLSYFYDPEISSINYVINTRFILYIILGIIVLLILAYILLGIYKYFNMSDHSYERYNKSTDTKKSDISKTPKILTRHKNINKKNIKGQIAIEMVVKNQNRQIGHRNIHSIGESHPLSVGGAGSEYFLIFIIATGKRIGEIVMENGIVSFIPKDKDFFPELNGNKFINCLSIPIKIVNKKGIETYIIFNEWISPVERLNRIMHLLDNKGMPEFKY